MILTDENFEQEIQKSEKPILVDFFATWCEPCSVLGPILEKAEKDMAGKFILAKVNLDQAPKTSQKFGIEKIPTVMLFRNGKPIDGFVGLLPESTLKEWLENSMNENTEHITEQTIEQIKEEYAQYAVQNGFKLNPDMKSVERIIKGLLENEKKYGKKYCPCRRVIGDLAEDSKKICPCVWHKDEIKKDGKCFCGLYVK